MAEEKKSYPVPYRSQLQERFEPGQTLIVKGRTIDESQRFTINFHTKAADFSGNDVPLHVSIRFDEGKIVLNSFANGEWGKEERKSNPIKRGEPFDIRVRAHDDRFEIIVDQKEFKEYHHRLPLSSISHFSIDGDLFLDHIHWGGKYYPVPYESGISTGFPVGKKLMIFGVADKKGKRFNVNLLRKNGDISLHFNPRFDEKHVIRNALQAGEWGNEEREGKLPFEKGVGFDLTIINEPTHFEVLVDDKPFCSFAHRSDPNDIHGLQIQGDIELTGIQIVDK
ncbi:galectin [Aphelenchoides avenae]|nr:galectin [Aphelenchus avenae]